MDRNALPISVSNSGSLRTRGLVEYESSHATGCTRQGKLRTSVARRLWYVEANFIQILARVLKLLSSHQPRPNQAGDLLSRTRSGERSSRFLAAAAMPPLLVLLCK